jgi:hypothetical protein
MVELVVLQTILLLVGSMLVVQVLQEVLELPYLLEAQEAQAIMAQAVQMVLQVQVVVVLVQVVMEQHLLLHVILPAPVVVVRFRVVQVDTIQIAILQPELSLVSQVACLAAVAVVTKHGLRQLAAMVVMDGLLFPGAFQAVYQ